MSKKNLSYIELILIPSFLDAHSDFGYDEQRYPTVTYDSYGYRVDFVDEDLQELWCEWQHCAYVLMGSIDILLDKIVEQE
ncbi:MAG TPA: hypothetical protein VFM18_04325 [Methanosarcina sp.]|nr:hypothetical protein [Methanosarcina sp.]